MRHAAEIQCVVYAIAATLFGFIIFGQMALIVWGVPIHPLLLVAFVSSIVLLVGAVKSASRPALGRKIAIVGIVGLGTVCGPWLIALVPRHNVINSPISYVVIAGYVALVAFCLFFPRPLKFGIFVFVLLCGAATACFAITYQKYVRMGEYDRPRIDCFRWYAEPKDDLIIAEHSEEFVDPELKTLLQKAGIRGTLKWRGGSDTGIRKRMIVLMQRKSPLDAKLYYSKAPLILYAYDGNTWLKFPPETATYPLFSTFEDTENSEQTMLCHPEIDGGKQCTPGFQWNGRDKSDVPPRN
jgi:hypothetical protein